MAVSTSLLSLLPGCRRGGSWSRAELQPVPDPGGGEQSAETLPRVLHQEAVTVQEAAGGGDQRAAATGIRIPQLISNLFQMFKQFRLSSTELQRSITDYKLKLPLVDMFG